MIEGATEGSESAKSARLAFVGDLLLGRHISAKLTKGFPPADLWRDVRPLMTSVDAVIGNLECAVTRRGTPWPHPKAFRFCADPVVLEALKAGNVRAVALANNHVLDYSEEGLADTRMHLAEAGIAFAGAGADLAQALEPAVFAAGPLTVGFVSITNTVPEFGAGPDKPGTAWLKIRNDAATFALISGWVDAMRRRGADLLVLGIHWGPNFSPWPPRRYRALAKRAIELGFDIVHGHSAHILQAVEFHRNGVILYDTGDFIDDFWVIPGLRNDRTVLFTVEVEPGRAKRLTMTPVSIRSLETHLAKGSEAEAIRRGMVRRCRGYAVELTDDGETLVAVPPSEATAEAHATPP